MSARLRGAGSFFLASLLLACAPDAMALDPGRPLTRFRRDLWGAEQGFPGGAVIAMAQGADGHLWLGTEKGLVRFDGTEFRLVEEVKGRPGPPAQILGLTVDDAGSLWARLGRPALMRLRGGALEQVAFATHPREVAATAMTRGRDGGVLVYGQVSGLLEHRDEAFESIAAGTVPASLVISLAQTPDGTVWMGTRDAGLFRLRKGAMTPVADGLPDRKVNCLLGEGDHALWVGTDRGVVRWNGTELTAMGLPPALRSVQALAMLRDRDGSLWIGTDRGLLRVMGEDVEALSSGPAPSSRPVSALFEDREGSLWVGGGDGVERLLETPFLVPIDGGGAPPSGTGPVHVDHSGGVWFGAAGGGLYRLDGAQARRLAGTGLDDDLVYSIAGRGHDLWVGGQRTGLTRLRLEGGSLQSRRFTEADGLAQAAVFAVHEGRDGTVWAGTLSAGLTRLRDGRLTTFTAASGLASNSVSAILDTADGTVWVATPAGLSALSEGRWRQYGTAEGLPGESVSCLLEDAKGVLWVGTTQGLAFLRSGRFEGLRSPPDSLHDAVLGLGEGEDGWLWIATLRRVLRVRREAVLEGKLTDGDVVVYGTVDGLPASEGVRRHRSVATDARGRAFVSTGRGLAWVDSRRAVAPSMPPLARVVAVSADGRRQSGSDPLRLPPRPQRVTFGFAAVSLAAPDRVRFRHRLDGLDHVWSEGASTREAVYTNLRPGPYRFRVMASGPDGSWSGPEAALDVVVTPALWQAAWFQIGALLAALGGARMIFGWRLGRETRRLNALFEERLAERTRIAQELHDTLLQGFVSASLQLHVAAEQVPEASPARGALHRVQQLMTRVIEEGRTTVGGLRSDRAPGDLAEALSRVGPELGAGGPVEAAPLRVIVEGTPRALRPSVRDGMYRIGREALVNAYLHARANRVEVELEYGEREVRLLVRDDGVGMDPQIVQSGREGHFGLTGMRERAESMGGRLRVWSAPGAGTEVELAVRSTLAFADPPPSGLRAWRRLLARVRGEASAAPAPDPENGRPSR